MKSFDRNIQVDALESRKLFTAVTFNVDSDLSKLTIAAKADIDNLGNVKMNAQDDGTDSANFEGTLVADISSKGVRFSGGSDIVGIKHDGSFDPGGGDAVYAVDGKLKKIITLATAKAAVRKLSLDITDSSRKPITGTRHKFQLRKGEMTINDGSVDYKIDSSFGDGDGTKSLDDLRADLVGGDGRVTGKKGSRIITIPIEVRFTKKFNGDADGVFTLKGQIVGREASAKAQAFVPGVFAATPIASKRKDDSAGDFTIL